MSKSVAQQHGIKYQFAKGDEDLSKMHQSSYTKLKSGRNAVQVALVATLHHVYVHGDWTWFQSYVDGMPEGTASKSMVKWIQAFTGLVIENKPVTDEDGNEKKVKAFANPFGKGGLQKHIEKYFDDAKATMFWSFNPPSVFEGFDFEQEIRNAIKRRNKLIKEVRDGKRAPEDRDKINLKLSDDLMDQLGSIMGVELEDALKAGDEDNKAAATGGAPVEVE